MSLNTISDKELIEKFLCSKLHDSEKLVFDERRKDETFMKLLEEAVIAYQGRLHLKEKLQKIGNEVKTEQQKIHRSSIVWMAGIAASVLLFFGIYFFRNPKLNADELFDTYFEVYPNAYTIKGNTSETNLSKEAFDFYDAAKYKRAMETFEKIAAKRTLNSSEHFYYGIALLTDYKIEDAKNQFKKVTALHPLYNEAQWYTSLSLIKQDSVDKAKKLLANTRQQFSANRKKNVQNLLDQLQ